ncbi:ABC transporter permease [uncultured Cyclobacterium sp.]|uniref:ABC transporter permease n=1 Tax=uncultured Cyclobacterium sp. TaxID=453820 RepID=UPI0030EC4F9B|tara:strand:+ start:75654 stop:78083 length:2430 start_codon:yes stop_codon:yes gene_type:complete
MYRNYLKIAFRSIWKNKTFSLINIIGLSIGLSAAFVIGIMIYYDLTFDKIHADKERIYRIVMDTKGPDRDGHSRGVPVPLIDALQNNSTGIDNVAPFFVSSFTKVTVASSQKEFNWPGDVVIADQEYFKIFEYQWLAGSPGTALENPYEVVLSKGRAEKYFPGKSPDEIIGNTLIYEDSLSIKVTGIVLEFEERSDFTFKEFIARKSFQNLDKYGYFYDESWGSVSSSTQLFIKTDKFNSKEAVQAQLDVLEEESRNEEMAALGYFRSFHLQPLKELHLGDNYGVFDNSNYRASSDVLFGLGFIAVFLLLLGCINFINLNTAQSAKRAKEIGIRKTLGSSKKQLVIQFLGETFILTLSAAILSIFLAIFLLREFAEFMPSGLGLDLMKSPVLILSLILLLVLITFLSGFYPGLVLSQFKPVSVLKNQSILDGEKGDLRKYLTVFQFVIAQVFIIATLLVGKQINYLINKDMGFKKESVAYVRAPSNPTSVEKIEAFREVLTGIPEIKKLSKAGAAPASQSYSGRGVSYFSGGKETHVQIQLLYGDENYLDLYGIELSAGRLPLNDSISEYVVNETLMRQLGFQKPNEVIGQQFKVNDENIPIVGVMKDFNQSSLREEIEPMAFIQNSQSSTIHFSFQANDVENWPLAINKIEAYWKEFFPKETFRINFIDEDVKQFYRQEEKMATLLKWATGLAILISCLGLLGLVIHTTEKRTKEIGIRKVLGASLFQLNILLGKEFMVLVGIAFIIAVPVSIWGINIWLQDFAYKTALSWWVFLLGGLSTTIIALIVISIKIFLAANANPVKSLSTE